MKYVAEFRIDNQIDINNPAALCRLEVQVLKNFYPKQAIMRGDLEGAKVSEYWASTASAIRVLEKLGYIFRIIMDYGMLAKT